MRKDGGQCCYKTTTKNGYEDLFLFMSATNENKPKKKLGDAEIYNRLDGDAGRKSEGEVGHRDACLPI